MQATHEPVACLQADGTTASLEILRGTPVAAFCGLANPQAFVRTLTGIGVELLAVRTYPDHHFYTQRDLNDLACWARALAANAVIVTTQKDLVKLRLTQLGGQPLCCLRVRLRIESGREEFHRLLDAVTGRSQPDFEERRSA
jgi:tetraacyldisaccharide 4'-kinase